MIVNITVLKGKFPMKNADHFIHENQLVWCGVVCKCALVDKIVLNGGCLVTVSGVSLHG